MNADRHGRSERQWRHARLRRVLALVSGTLLLVMAGCMKPVTVRPGYYGPTESMAAVVQRINQNNRAIPTLYARHDIEANIVDPQRNKARFVNASGDLFVRKPRELWLRGRKDVAGKVFEMGSTPELFWFTVYVGDDPAQWWGHYRNVGKPCAEEIPVRPDLIGEVLGIGDIQADFLQAPMPVMRFNNDLDVYMLVWGAKLPDRWYAEKEVWYDRKTLKPMKVLLFDTNGRIVLRADLSRHQAIEIPGTAAESWPQIATVYDLFFPETKSTMTLKLSDIALSTKTGHPKEGTIAFREDADVRVIQIDEACEK